MAIKIKWTQHAIDDYAHIVDYLRNKWSAASAEKFLNIVESRVDQLSYFPLIGIASQKNPAIRYIIITKHNKLYYRFNNNVIEVLNIFDTRQHPDKNTYE